MIMAYISQLLWALPGDIVNKVKGKRMNTNKMKEMGLGFILVIGVLSLFILPKDTPLAVEPTPTTTNTKITKTSDSSADKKCEWDGLKKRRVCK